MTTATASAIGALVKRFPDSAKDIKLNLQNVLKAKHLNENQVWGTALACAYNEGRQELIQALLEEGADQLTEEVIADAQAAAALMSMNNVYYRFRHVVGNPAYQQRQAQLRMTAMGRPKTDRTTFELFSLAVSAINGCGMCMTSHEKVLRDHGLSEDGIHDGIRIAAVVRAAAVTLGIAQ